LTSPVVQTYQKHTERTSSMWLATHGGEMEFNEEKLCTGKSFAMKSSQHKNKEK